MLRAICAFVSVIATMGALIGYMLVFVDEMEPQHPANLGMGPLAPMYRHWMEFVLIGWTVLPTVAIGFYLLIGAKEITTINLPFVRRHLFRLHAASGVIIITGLSISLVNGQPIQWRDSITACVGLGILAIGIWERTWHSQTT